MKRRNDPDLIAYRMERDPRKKRRLADKLVRENQPLVAKLVQKFARFAPSTVEMDDLLQAGYIAFLYTINNIDITRTFSTYYAFRVWYEVSKILEKHATIFHPRGTGMPFKVLKKIEAFRTRFAREPTDKDLGLPFGQLEQWALMPTCHSLDFDPPSGQGLHDTMPDSDMDPEQRMIAKEEAQEELRARLKSLPEG